MGSQQTALTNGSGFYSMSSIVGTYNIRFSKFGYESVLLTDIEILDQQVTVANAELISVPTFTVFTDNFESGSTGWVAHCTRRLE